MSETRVDLQKEVFNKLDYPRTINIEFTELSVPTVNDDLDTQVTVEDFFNLYNDLFYDIPAEGESNSHAYLVRTSGEYIAFDETDAEIEALRDEITTLREDNLALEQEIVTLSNPTIT
tara:strand:+ start:397 stop:750 length:354 start_codon:yes stop_codon:yes gene_type:complete